MSTQNQAQLKLNSRSDYLRLFLNGAKRISTSSNDIILAFLIIAIIGLMILPLPLVLIDTLVAMNIALGVMLVLMAIYVNSALQFSAFPSVLLISTLFRLALSIATTRMILLEGDAGNIIDTFGSMVAGGNIVVGLVVFLIITLVQFLVIAKGSERVAEVGARFTLDAMPGKQLSIDSDLRSGLIDKTEARKKRSDLEKESQLHGSLDGAMKFVKGDAIAGIVVIIINLLGGLAVGVFQIGMSTGDAINKYSILTIGDGLVAQIPALFGAMAAGLIVTRVSDADSDEHLGDAIQQQFAAIPRVLLVAGVMCMFFAFVPGFPSGIFTGLGILLFFAGAMLVPAFNVLIRSYSAPAFDVVLQRKAENRISTVEKTHTVSTSESTPLTIKLPHHLSREGGDKTIQRTLQTLLAQHNEATGVTLPTMAFEWLGGESERWSLEVFDVPVISGRADKAVSLDDIAHSGMLAIRKNISLFIGLEQTNRLLLKTADQSPEVVSEVQRALSLQAITVIVRNLVDEEVPIKNLAAALEGVASASSHEKDLQNLTEYGRISLGRQLCHKYSQEGVLDAIGLSLTVEEELLGMMREQSGTSEFGISPQYSEKIVHALTNAIQAFNPSIIVVPVIIRRHIRKLISDQCFETPVLSYPEITKPFTLNVISRVELPED